MPTDDDNLLLSWIYTKLGFVKTCELRGPHTENPKLKRLKLTIFSSRVWNVPRGKKIRSQPLITGVMGKVPRQQVVPHRPLDQRSEINRRRISCPSLLRSDLIAFKNHPQPLQSSLSLKP
ncbi:hypothetical protein R6Q57_025685 [Mikania cordata]